jgi:hypothetical protein
MRVFETHGWGGYYKSCSSHYPLLIKCILKTDGPILELGTGFFSTTLLHWLASERQRPLYSYDDNLDFWQLNKKFQNKYHRIRLTKDWKDIPLHKKWSVVFVDQSTRNRTPTAIAVKDISDYVVIHDTDSDHPYHYDKVWPHYKYRYDYTKQHPWTTVVSNFNDLKWLEDSIL